MQEFDLIRDFFKKRAHLRSEIKLGIGDDCAILSVPNNHELVLSTDTLVADVHFLSTWDPFDIAYKGVMVNISDCAAMAAEPIGMLLALTLPQADEQWLARFSDGLFQALDAHHVSLIGGDTTHGPLSLTLTVQGIVPTNQSIRRTGAQKNDKIYVTGLLGLAAFGVSYLDHPALPSPAKQLIYTALHRPQPCTAWRSILRKFATSAIDISDGLLGDLNHICEASQLGALINMSAIPVHPLLKQFSFLSDQLTPLDFALKGGDDYELCFTVPAEVEKAFLNDVNLENLVCYCIGEMKSAPGLYTLNLESQYVELKPEGYRHF